VTLSEFAPAKINLFLHVTGKRADGYHLLDSLAVFAGVGDLLSAERSNGLTLRVTGRFAAGLDGEGDNLVLRAARALADAAGIAPNAALVLEKSLPVASGIGGGSADAAAALRLLIRLWGVTIAPDTLHWIAERLGADVPVCLQGVPMRMRGVGEQLDPAPVMPDYGLLLVNPGVALPTAAVFRARNAAFSPGAGLPASWDDSVAMAATLDGLSNDLQPPAVGLQPVIADVLAAIAARPGCLLARMSGSGATCFGIFPTPDQATRAAASVARDGWWTWGGGPASA
jgi:4-diphosphocytidyl-2-C-methyl-D-erythritol kinase